MGVWDVDGINGTRVEGVQQLLGVFLAAACQKAVELPGFGIALRASSNEQAFRQQCRSIKFSTYTMPPRIYPKGLRRSENHHKQGPPGSPDTVNVTSTEVKPVDKEAAKLFSFSTLRTMLRDGKWREVAQYLSDGIEAATNNKGFDKEECVIVIRSSILSDKWDEDRLLAKQAMQRDRRLAMPPITEKRRPKSDERLPSLETQQNA